MDKLKMHTVDRAEENFKKLCELFPNAVTETKNENGEVVRAIDADVLRQEISGEVVEGSQERYQFTWPDKKKSVVLANQPIAKTLRLEREKSVGRDGTAGSIDTENIYIEGDNLDALKLLQETYLGKVKMIYIDPPYNTGNDFVYDDDFSQDKDEYITGSGQLDEQGRQLVQNPESNGRFHTDWLNMLYPRLRIARDLLSDDGVIFISIDDNEQENLKKICDEIFGPRNFIGQWNWFKSATPPNLSKKIKKNIEYILCYEKSKTNIKYSGIKKVSKSSNGLMNQTNSFHKLIFPKNIVETGLPDGKYFAGKYGTSSYDINLLNDVEVKNGIFVTEVCLEGKFKWGQENLMKEIQSGTKISIRTDTFSPSYDKTDYDPEVPPNFIDKSVGVDTTEQAGKLLDSMFDEIHIFDYPKPIELIKYLCNFMCGTNDTIMDFFSGSATTAHAVMQLNAEDGGNRKYIMVQLPELTDEKSEARKAGYKTICDIGEERIRRAGKKIKDESPMTTTELDTGFRVFRVDSSNMQNVYYAPADFKQEQLELLADNIKPDRTPTDLLFQVMLDLGITLSAEINETEIDGKKVFSVADGYMIACFDNDITEQTVTEIAKKQPFYAVFRDSGMASDSVMTNFEQIFETYSPNTERKIL